MEAQTLKPDGTGNGDWDTLPDVGGHTGNATGASSDAGWSEELHNHLRHYMTYDPAANGGAGGCTPTGTTGYDRERQLRWLAGVEHRPVRL